MMNDDIKFFVSVIALVIFFLVLVATCNGYCSQSAAKKIYGVDLTLTEAIGTRVILDEEK